MKGEPPESSVPTARPAPTASKSPRHKVLKFFNKSRAQWKGQWRAAKAELKTLQKKRYGMAERQPRGQSRVKVVAGELPRLRAEHRPRAEAGEAGEKKER